MKNGLVIDPDGSKHWWVDGKRHRTDGPAVEWITGSKRWYVDGKLHRTDGPAIDRPDGSREWYVDGKRHRLDGPAIEDADGTIGWWVNGMQYDSNKSFQQAAGLSDERMAMLVLKHGDVG